jgi:hypothetical protein
MAPLRTLAVQQDSVCIGPRNPTTKYIPPGAVTFLGCNRFETNHCPGILIFVEDLEDVHRESGVDVSTPHTYWDFTLRIIQDPKKFLGVFFGLGIRSFNARGVIIKQLEGRLGKRYLWNTLNGSELQGWRSRQGGHRYMTVGHRKCGRW